MPRPTLTVIDIIKVMKKYKTLTEMKKRSPGAYEALNRLPNVQELKSKYFPSRFVQNKTGLSKIERLKVVKNEINNCNSLKEFYIKFPSSANFINNQLSKSEALKLTNTLKRDKPICLDRKVDKYSIKEIKLIISKYKNHSIFKKENLNIYEYIIRHGLHSLLSKLKLDREFTEDKVEQPLFIKTFTELNNVKHIEVFKFKKSNLLSRGIKWSNFRDLPDVCVYNNQTKKFIIIEIKPDVNPHNTLNQYSRYKKHVKGNCVSLYFFSPNGGILKNDKIEIKPFNCIPELIERLSK